MSCLRCQGFVCCERLAKDGLWWWRCVQCGDRMDDVILRNRAEQAAARTSQLMAQERDEKDWASWLRRVPA